MEADLATLRNVEQTMLALAQLMVDDPEDVRLEVILKPAETLIRLHVAPHDVGKLIGKEGRTARSLRIILSAIGMKYRHSFSLDIVESQEPRA
jgi:predicted RNA-binding protein YlqC (UPF0109 family)